MTQLPDPLTAATHHNPYPYYGELVATKPLYYDDALGLWVASSAEVVTSVFNATFCRVRPVTEPVPRALLESSAATIFRHLVRMNDGAGHRLCKQAVSATLASIKDVHVIEQSNRWASMLAARYGIKDTPEHLADFAFRLPVCVVSSLLGIPHHMLDQTALWVNDFVGCLAPTSSTEQVERGKQAAAHLQDMFRSLLHTQQSESTDGLLAILAHEAKRVERDDTDSIIANGVGFLSQAYEATAGLIGNTLLALASRPEMRNLVRTHPPFLDIAIQETLRYDPPIQNTRRFLSHNGVIAGQEMQAGETILLLLAAANHDPQVNPSPSHFDLWRRDRRIFSFGLGAHACPGEALAPTIARAGVEQLLAVNVWSDLCSLVSYRASTNARVALIGKSENMQTQA